MPRKNNKIEGSLLTAAERTERLRAGAQKTKQIMGRTATAVERTDLAVLASVTNVFVGRDRLQSLSPGQVAHMRSKIAGIIGANLDVVGQVLDGTTVWSPTQARVFSTLLNKVIPDLNASYHQHEHRNADLKQMSRADLERIAAGLDDTPTIDADFTPVPPETDDENP